MKLYTQEQVNELMVLLQQSFLPENIECDGAHCMGCWKDVVRETLKKMINLTPIELPSDEEIEENSMEFYDNNGADYYFEKGAYWVIEQIKQEDNGHT